MNAKTILLIEDNLAVQTFNQEILSEEGFTVKTALTLAEAEQIIQKAIIDLIVLDIGMPDGNGLTFLKDMRQKLAIPVLILSGFSNDDYIVKGFDTGCDDYLAKPYSFRVLLARIKRLLKLGEKINQKLIKGALILDLELAQATINGLDLQLSIKQFALLRLFAESENQVLSLEYIYLTVWGAPLNNDSRALTNNIYRLRKKLNNCGYTIRAVYGSGYVFETV